MEESFISPGRAIEIHGLPPTLKKAKPDSLAKPGLLRNSGGEWGEILVSTLAARLLAIPLCVDILLL